MLRGSFLWGLNICVGQKDKEETDQKLDRVYVYYRGGYGPDARGIHDKSMGGGGGGEREQRLRQGPGVTSGLGGRGPVNMPMVIQPLVRRWANVLMSACPNIGPTLANSKNSISVIIQLPKIWLACQPLTNIGTMLE